MKFYLPVIVLFFVVGCHNYEMDNLDTSDEHNQLLNPPCLNK